LCPLLLFLGSLAALLGGEPLAFFQLLHRQV
jgi:hypothetical protein